MVNGASDKGGQEEGKNGLLRAKVITKVAAEENLSIVRVDTEKRRPGTRGLEGNERGHFESFLLPQNSRQSLDSSLFQEHGERKSHAEGFLDLRKELFGPQGTPSKFKKVRAYGDRRRLQDFLPDGLQVFLKVVEGKRNCGRVGLVRARRLTITGPEQSKVGEARLRISCHGVEKGA
jgi:hypothetical protein